MKITVERCWNGRMHYFRLQTPRGMLEVIAGETWNRAMAKEALDIYERLYKFKRSSIRFVHK